MSKSGNLNEGLINKLNKIDYYDKTHPKSLGIEWVNSTIIPLLDIYPGQIVDLLHTFSSHTVSYTHLRAHET